jgi:hypothetical protein
MLTRGRTLSRVIAEVMTTQLRCGDFNTRLLTGRIPAHEGHVTCHDMLTPDLLKPAAE